MSVIKYIFVLLMTVLLSNAYASVSNKGTEFYFSIGPNVNHINFPTTLTVFVSSDEDTKGIIKIDGLNFEKEFDVVSDQITEIQIPPIADEIPANVISNYGIHLISGKDVSVHVMSRVYASTDIYTALPLSAIGWDYIVSTRVGSPFKSNVIITAAYDNTTVTITPSVWLAGFTPVGVPFDIVLNKSETYMATGVDSRDISGTLISSSAPITVVAGSQCASVLDGVCDHLAEQLPPITAWGQEIITIPLASRLEGDVIRIVSSTDNTEVSINNYEKVILNKGEIHEGIYTEALVINANNPILVTQLSISGLHNGVTADPFLMVIPATDQFLQSYTFMSPNMEVDQDRHYINVVVKNEYIDSILLDDQLVDSSSFISIAESGYSGAQLQIDPGAHKITSINKFGLFIYGFRNWESYGYPGGMSLETINYPADKYAPNIVAENSGGFIFVSAGDNEDVNLNGILDVGEDSNFDNVINARTEDINGNGQLDSNEDINGNGEIDQDSGIRRIELGQDSNNLKLELDGFVPGVSTVSFVVSLIDPTKTGSSTIIITDLAGNKSEMFVEVYELPTLTNVEVVSTINTHGIEIIPVSFKSTPTETQILQDKIVVKWVYDVFQLGQKEDLSYSVVVNDPIALENRQITKDLIVNYVDIRGESTTISLGEQVVNVLPAAVSIAIDTDKGIYSVDEEIIATARIKNLSTASQEVLVRVIMTDINNNMVDILSPTSTLVLQGGEEALIRELVYDANRVLSGDYKVVAQVLSTSGHVIDDYDFAFTIKSDIENSLVLTVRSDKNTYINNEPTAVLTTNVRNMSSNTIMSNASLELLITDSRRMHKSIFVDLPEMLSGAIYSNSVKYDINQNGSNGTYTIDAIIRDYNGEVLATDRTSFVFIRDEFVDIDAEVTVEYDVLNQGDEQVCTTTLSGDGFLFAPTRRVLINADSKNVISSYDWFAFSYWGGGASATDNIDTASLEPGVYTCLIEVPSNGSNGWKTIAYNSFEIVGDKVTLSSHLEPGKRDRILVLLDNEKDNNGATGHIPELSVQRAYLESMLDNNLWRYVITDTAEEFTNQMRTGEYEIFLIGSEKEKLDEQSQKELREAIYSGSGLIYAGMHDQRMHINEALGIKFIGNVPNASGLSISTTDWNQEGTEVFNLINHATRAELTSADLIASYIDNYGADLEYPAISVNQFGKGKSVYLGFDLLAEAAVIKNHSGFYSKLINNSVEFSQRETINLLKGSLYPVTIFVSNDGQQTDGRVIVNIENMDYVDSSSPVIVEGDQVIWNFSLEENEEALLTIWIRLPNEQFLIDTLVQSYDGSAYIDQQRYETYLQPESLILLNQIIEKTSLNSAFKIVTKWLNSAQNHFDNDANSLALADLVKASDACAKLDSNDSTDLAEIRANIGLIIKETERNL